ncbi:MAG: hypothetical protein ABIA93_07880 [Candidatus Woesearchaeota archaeon]
MKSAPWNPDFVRKRMSFILAVFVVMAVLYAGFIVPKVWEPLVGKGFGVELPPGDGGGGGGEPCVPTWSCTDWTVCSMNNQTRICTDLNFCGTNDTKPVEIQSCTCEPNWTCTDWGNCTDGAQNRTCTDDNVCGVLDGKPPEIQFCENCTSLWNCTAWDVCTNDTQSRICTDLNNCGVNDTKPEESMPCENCTPSWSCTAWSSCVSSSQSRTCTDANSCGTTDGKPASTQSCTTSSGGGGGGGGGGGNTQINSTTGLRQKTFLYNNTVNKIYVQYSGYTTIQLALKNTAKPVTDLEEYYAFTLNGNVPFVTSAVSFTVPTSWITENGVQDISIYYMRADTPIKIVTKNLGIKGAVNEYTSQITTYGTYMIAGKAVAPQTDNPPEQEQPAGLIDAGDDDANEETSEPPAQGSTLWIFIILGLLVLIGGGTTGVVLLKHHPKTQAIKTDSSNSAVFNFVRAAKARAMPDSEIIKALKQHGWPDDYVNLIMKTG